MSASMISSIREYLLTCPALTDGVIHVNFLDSDPITYTIDEVAAQPVVKRYTDGSTVRQVVFILASSEYYSRDALENLKTCGVYEQIADWMERQSNAGNLPALTAGTAQKIEATTNGYCMSADIQENIQRYQIQCRLTYLKEALS